MERKLKPIKVERALKETGLRLFSPEEFRRFFNVSLRAAQEFIKDHQQDLFEKLRNGLYALKSESPHELEIANRLYQPSYVSFEYALAYYQIIPETTYTITSATTKTTRQFLAQDKVYEYSKIKKAFYLGYQLVTKDKFRFLMATPEKALVDYCYFVDLGLKSLNERLRLDKLNKKKTLAYAKLFDRLSLERLIKEVL